MAEIRLDGVSEGVPGRRPRRRRRQPDDRERRVHGARRPVGLRQVDAAADDRRARGDHRRRHLDRRPCRHEPLPPRSRHRDGLPELRALPAPDRAQEPRLRPAHAQDAEGRDRAARRTRSPAMLGLEELLERRPGDALGRPAPARRDGPRDRARAAGLPHGRAALEPRRQAARRHARRARAPARAARRDDRLRHARPGRGDDARRARRRDARRPHPAGRHAADALPASPRTCSWPRSSARRR